MLDSTRLNTDTLGLNILLTSHRHTTRHRLPLDKHRLVKTHRDLPFQRQEMLEKTQS